MKKYVMVECSEQTYGAISRTKGANVRLKALGLIEKGIHSEWRIESAKEKTAFYRKLSVFFLGLSLTLSLVMIGLVTA